MQPAGDHQHDQKITPPDLGDPVDAEFSATLKVGRQVEPGKNRKTENPEADTERTPARGDVAQGGQQFWWPLLADSGPPDMLRKLRVFGRWHIQIPTANQN